MRGRHLAALLSLSAFVFAPITVIAQTRPAEPRASRYVPPRTPWGQPDLQGIWNNVTATPLQRPAEFKDRAFLTKEEAAEFAARAAQREADGESRPTAQQTPGQRTGYASSIWFETTHSLSDNRTSLLVDQEDGRLPALTPEGQKIAQQLAEGAKLRPADDPEDRGAYERCISRGLPGAMMPGFYNHNYQIVQTRDYVVISVEMIHDARIIPLAGRPITPGLNQWLGNSRGRFEGNTLVVESTGFRRIDQRNVALFGTSERGRVIERFTPTSAGTMDYTITIDDPAIYTRSWTASIPMTKVEGPLYEYACHEGNYGLRGVMAGHRKEEEEKASGTAAPQR
jgi:hypothetical protein